MNSFIQGRAAHYNALCTGSLQGPSTHVWLRHDARIRHFPLYSSHFAVCVEACNWLAISGVTDNSSVTSLKTSLLDTYKTQCTYSLKHYRHKYLCTSTKPSFFLNSCRLGTLSEPIFATNLCTFNSVVADIEMRLEEKGKVRGQRVITTIKHH